MTLLTVNAFGVQYRQREVLSGVALDVGPGEVVGLIGPNGAGKTTLLRAMLGLQPGSGHCNLLDMSAAARAQHVAFLPQGREVAWPVTVETVVALGRSAYRTGLRRPTDADKSAVERALSRLKITHLRTRPATELSGGEQARVLIARVLAQETPLILADEPVSGLDPAAQIGVMEVFSKLAAEHHGIVVSIHDLGLAARHCTRILALSGGRVAADGAPSEVLTPALLADVFGIEAFMEQTSHGTVFQAIKVLRG